MSEKTDDSLFVTGTKGIDLPKIKHIRLGEYGRQLEKIWDEFARIRQNGVYMADNNQIEPSFNDRFIVHGFVGRDSSDFSKIKKMTTIGVVSSDIEFVDAQTLDFPEEETPGTADFFMSDKPVSCVHELLTYLRRRIAVGKEYITDLGDGPDSATLMFVFDSANPELSPLIQWSMKDNQAEETLWPNRLGQEYIDFPMKGSGLHMAVPVGLPANYIEYILVNERSSSWQDDRLNQLREVSFCDGHKIPLVSVNSGSVL